MFVCFSKKQPARRQTAFYILILITPPEPRLQKKGFGMNAKEKTRRAGTIFQPEAF